MSKSAPSTPELKRKERLDERENKKEIFNKKQQEKKEKEKKKREDKLKNLNNLNNLNNQLNNINLGMAANPWVEYTRGYDLEIFNGTDPHDFIDFIDR